MSDEWPSPAGKSDKRDKRDRPLSTAPSRSSIATRLYQGTIAVLAVLCLVVYILKIVDTGKLDDQLEADRTECTTQAVQALSSQTEELLRLHMVTLVQSLGGAMKRNDTAEISQLIEGLVKHRHVVGISVADDSGTIVAATNKKWEGTNLEGVFPGVLHDSQEVSIRSRDEDFLVIGPIVVAEQRSGTAVLTYSRDTVSERLPRLGEKTP